MSAPPCPPAAAGAASLSTSLLSVVITSPAQRHLSDAFEAIDSLARQSYRHVEIIFVSEGGMAIEKNVEAFAERMGISNLLVISNDGPSGLSFARNVGIQRASGDIVAFIDDDAIAPTDWAEHVVGAFEEYPQAIGITGPAYPYWTDLQADWYPEEFYWILSCPTPGWTGYTTPTPIRNAWGVNMAFRREAVEAARFSETFVGGSRTGADDVDFSMRVRAATRKPILFHPSVCVYHKVSSQRLSSSFVRRKAFRDGYAKAALRALYKEGHEARFTIDIEAALLKKILFRFLPRLATRSVRDPRRVWLCLRLAAVALFYGAAGYFSGTVSSFRSRLRNETKFGQRES